MDAAVGIKREILQLAGFVEIDLVTLGFVGPAETMLKILQIAEPAVGNVQMTLCGFVRQLETY